MRTRQIILLCIALAALTVAGLLTVSNARRTGAETEDYPDGIPWLCTNPDCGAEIVVTLDEMSDFFLENPDRNSLRCPKCGQYDTARAARCPDCKRLYPRQLARQAGRSVCPSCRNSNAPSPEGSQ
ncbi:MAG: hypothetical protein JSV19_00030 [Phycisphaerales bacterium]|nr:MAG: hypothetical protein JSV19_00030 [Phycisphaerales bacterium]